MSDQKCLCAIGLSANSLCPIHGDSNPLRGFICAAWKKRTEGPMASRRTLVFRCDRREGHEGDHVDAVLGVNWPESESDLECRPRNEWNAVVDQLPSEGIFIGGLRGQLFVPFDCKWNGIVRDVTAQHEHSGMVVSELVVLRHLVDLVRNEGSLDHSYPDRKGSGTRSLFESLPNVVPTPEDVLKGMLQAFYPGFSDDSRYSPINREGMAAAFKIAEEWCNKERDRHWEEGMRRAHARYLTAEVRKVFDKVWLDGYIASTQAHVFSQPNTRIHRVTVERENDRKVHVYLDGVIMATFHAGPSTRDVWKEAERYADALTREIVLEEK
jgi:hypothetical protein